MNQNKVLTTVYNSMFIVISLILGFFGRLSIFPVFPFLKLDFSDIPVFLVTLIFGIPSGILVLLISSVFRALMFSSSGWIGLVIRSTSLIVVVFIGMFYKEKFKKVYKILGITLGIFLCLTIKLILNYFLWINFFSISPELLNTFMASVIIPYNLLKLIITTVSAILLVNPVKKLIKSFKK